MLELRRLGVVAIQPAQRVARQVAILEPYRDQIATWLDQDHLLLTRIQELLDTQHRVKVKYTTLAALRAGLWKQPRSTVRMAPTAPGEVAEMDFGKLGTLIDPNTGKRQVVYCLLVVLVYSRYAFVWPLVQQTVEATIEGLEQAWRFFGGLSAFDSGQFPAAVADLTRSTRGRRAHVWSTAGRAVYFWIRLACERRGISRMSKMASNTYASAGGRAVASSTSPIAASNPRMVPRGGWCARTRHHATFATRRL